MHKANITITSYTPAMTLSQAESHDKSDETVPLPNIALQKQQGITSNRLAPYNPTHATAREKALDLLDLSNSDVLFDLGCGDGRLLLTAMERFYDDDYLMQQHQKIFNSVVTTTTHQPLQLESIPSGDCDDIVDGGHDVREVTFKDNTRNMSQSLGSHSQPPVPHMMCTASDDEEEESHDASFDTPNKMLSVALNTPQISAVSTMMMSPLHVHSMPTTPTMSNRKSYKNDFPTLHLSPINNEAIQDVPLTITASSSNEEPLSNQEESEASSSHLYSSSMTNLMGLRCVGIEYDQALVEAANNQIDTSLKMYESFDDGDWVKKRLCIRWGCVFDEWKSPDLRGSVDGKIERFAQHLRLMEDATAVFVYLLPEGLKKVKPLLQEAARRRREQIMCNEEQQQEEQLQQTHRKDYSHVSDITDDFFRVMQGSDAVTETRTTSSPPAFRVVSYMFSIPGWTPTKVDRSSKGSCPLYLYENVTEE